MSRYFINVLYQGTHYAGFQIQQNANSIQAEIEKALKIYFKANFQLTCSSRTDAGVHAFNNFFHFDAEGLPDAQQLNNAVYSLNSILPDDIVIKRIREVASDAHARFDATSREYTYHIYRGKNPFISDRAYYYPYKLDLELLNEAATILKEYDDFTSFSKRNTQVKTFICQLTRSYWESKGDRIIYTVEGNRFLRGMVRGLVGTMLRVGTGKLSLDGFRGVIEGKDASKADFSVPGHGLFLMEVKFPYPVS